MNFRELPVKKPLPGQASAFLSHCWSILLRPPQSGKGRFDPGTSLGVPGVSHHPVHSREPVVKERFQSVRARERHMREPCYRCCGGTE